MKLMYTFFPIAPFVPKPILKPFKNATNGWGDSSIDMGHQASPDPIWRPPSRAGSARSVKTSRTGPMAATVHTVSDEGSDVGFGGLFD